MLDRPHTDTPPDAYALFFFELCRAAMDSEQDPDKQLELLAKLITDAELAKQIGSRPPRTGRRRVMVDAPELIWAKLDRATIYMDGSSPLVARTREFRGSTAYVRADLYATLEAQLAAERAAHAETKRERGQLLDKLHCMCGSPIDHSAWEGHTPVSVYDYSLDQERSRAEAAEASLASERAAHAETKRERDEALKALEPFAEVRKALGMMLKEHDILSGNFGEVMDPKHKRPDRWPTAAEAARRALEGGE